MKRFLLIAGIFYYPSESTGDWVDSFDTEDEAYAAAATIKANPTQCADWFAVVDLDTWLPRKWDPEYGFKLGEPEPKAIIFDNWRPRNAG